MTDIVDVPQTLPIAPFPALGSANYNQEAYDNGVSVPPAIERLRAIVDAGRTNALATKEIADDAKQVTEQNVQSTQAALIAASAAAAASAASANFYGPWSALSGALNMPANVTHDDKDWRLMRNLIDVTAAEPGISDAWEEVNASGFLIRQTRTANVALDSSARGQLIDIASGTFTQTFAATATLGDGWWCYLKNSGSGDITLDPNAAELIDGLTSYIMYPGEVRLVQCDGAALRSVVLNSFYRVFTASGTFTKPPGYVAFEGLLWGGGASGSATVSTANGAGGGGGGACAPLVLSANVVSSTVAVTIGAGGGAVSGSATGIAGGNSTFGSLITSYGGGAGWQGAATGNVPGGGGGGVLGSPPSPSSSSATINGGSPSTSGELNNPGYGGGGGSTGAGGASVYGGGAGGSGKFIAMGGGASIYGGGGGGGSFGAGGGGIGGGSRHGGSGGAGALNTTAADGIAPGGGGGGVVANSGSQTSGAGARGELRIWGII